MAKTLNEQLYEALSTGITKGHLEPGLVLLEGPIAEIFGVSRSPVRQTLARLHDEGMISRFEGRGYLIGQQPAKRVRRSLTAADFRATGGKASIERLDSWRHLSESVERDVVLCSMKGPLELNELQLAKSLGVSRTVTHRILLQLQSLGLIEKVKYSSWEVVPLDGKRLNQLYEARRQLEPFMVERASRRMPREDLVGYLARLNDAEERYPDIPGTLLDALEHDLHHDVLQMGENREIFTMLRRTRPILLVSKHLLGASVAMPLEDPFFADHRRVFEAMLSERHSQAGHALHTHLARSEAKVQERLKAFHDDGEVAKPSYLNWA
ncbi:GntR family transcriptional regulator [Halomonas elongata]|uniref:GntR family transcription regulator n=1 Tax=Halomonas elongata (strain ATCC 33173 / DSM 2581 / NBRC 15536 / NCIMB 2198 / 1H9) TaxID=768066 RepID=E1V494_HALED|nr:GntR family transcriptional regulator [Halomonas elongata]WBF18173.1 GntR family transcriptional regulator [Halomonas elongata]WPU47024.1 GntR family transcriptional regulator [Halomonas elongata DSM 2581]CBV40931.2 GntR family transcription regulator [Halomonas elongata DSM 2581]